MVPADRLHSGPTQPPHCHPCDQNTAFLFCGLLELLNIHCFFGIHHIHFDQFRDSSNEKPTEHAARQALFAMAETSTSTASTSNVELKKNCNLENIDHIADVLRAKTEGRSAPVVGIICGSGLSEITKLVDDPINVPYKDIPGFPTSHVKGHGNELVFGQFNGVPIICMKGRFHYYSGYTMQQVSVKRGGPEMCLVGHLLFFRFSFFLVSFLPSPCAPNKQVRKNLASFRPSFIHSLLISFPPSYQFLFPFG